MKVIEITSKKEEKVLQNYLVSNCGAWIKKSKLYVPLKKAISYFGSKKSFKSFVNHTSSSPLAMKQKIIDLSKLSALCAAEVIFRNEAI